MRIRFYLLLPLAVLSFLKADLVIITDPVNLINKHRFSVMAKFIYASLYDIQARTNWHKELYTEHLRYWNNCNGDPGKVNCNMYLQSFENLLKSLKENGFDKQKSVIPMSYMSKYPGTLSIEDGEHRVGACLYYKIPVVIKINETQNNTHDYSSSFFKSRKLKSSFLDAMALEYAKIKQNTYLVFIWPAAIGKRDLVNSILSKHGDIIYGRSISLTENGSCNLMHEIYMGESWVGNFENNFAGARNKAGQCFPTAVGHRTVEVFLWECNSLDKVRECKLEIRNLYNMGNHSVHINDSHKETVEISEILFNENGVHWLNYSKPKKFSNFLKYIPYFKNYVAKNNLDLLTCCIDGSAVLAFYGIRDCRDIDVIHRENITLRNDSIVGSHNFELNHYQKTADDIIYNPNNFFVYKGIKFCALPTLLKMKEVRNEDKDKMDIKLAKEFLSLR